MNFRSFLSWTSQVLFLTFAGPILAQTGSIHEPIRYMGGVNIDPSVHEGRLRYAIGVESRQTLRANRTSGLEGQNQGWTYSHASNLAYWNDHFFQQYLSNPVDEHIPPGQTLMVYSQDGRNWSEPRVTFPPYQPPTGVDLIEGSIGYMMHQRMGFYVSPENRLLTLAFYAHAEDPFTEGGIGRVVREIYPDLSLGPIYFIRYDSHTSWNESNTSFPFYQTSSDAGFVRACDSLLSDRLVTLQWWDEDHGLDGFYNIKEAGEALSYFHRKDGLVVALWKRSKGALSMDGGLTFSKPAKLPTLTMAGGKIWGQKTDDDRYAITYNPIDNDEYRYPLIITTSDDGILFDNMLLVQGEVPPRRFFGRWKDFGPCYVRGIGEGNGNPPGDDMWLTYSMNKEDIWVSRIPVPVRYTVTGDLNDHFESMQPFSTIDDWNTYSPLWAPVEVIEDNEGNHSIRLQDKDPYDYARAIRVFEEQERLKVGFDVRAGQVENGTLEIDVTDQFGNRAVRIAFTGDGSIKANNGHEQVFLDRYVSGQWYKIECELNASPHSNFSISIDGRKLLQNSQLGEAVYSVERLSFRTGPYRELPNRRTPNEEPGPPLPGADEPIENVVFDIDNVTVTAWK
ncbi:MAG: hypothetical protein IPL46_29240 [Saprospiraceae bacterium]|nr:hypothetical protein [Saprospiraceae bacterium]